MKYGNFYDRSFILIDDSNRTITLRTEPTLCKIKLTLLKDDIQLEADNMSKLLIPSKSPLKKGDLIHTTNMECKNNEKCFFLQIVFNLLFLQVQKLMVKIVVRK